MTVGGMGFLPERLLMMMMMIKVGAHKYKQACIIGAHNRSEEILPLHPTRTNAPPSKPTMDHSETHLTPPPLPLERVLSVPPTSHPLCPSPHILSVPLPSHPLSASPLTSSQCLPPHTHSVPLPSHPLSAPPLTPSHCPPTPTPTRLPVRAPPPSPHPLDCVLWWQLVHVDEGPLAMRPVA